MRVLFLASYFPKPTNPEMGTWALGQAQALVRGGIDLHVISFTSYVPMFLARTTGARSYALCPHSYEWENVKVHYPRWCYYPVGFIRKFNGKFPGFSMLLAWQSTKTRLLSIVDEFKPDVIYAHHTLPNGYLAYRVFRERGIPYVITDHDFGDFTECYKTPARKRAMAPIANHASAMISVSGRMEALAKSLFPNANTQTILNGTIPIRSEYFTISKPIELKDKRIIFSCGMFYERKGFPLLIRAFAQIAKKFPDVVLRIAGDGTERSNVERAIDEHKLQDQITLLGRQTHERVMQEMAWCDLFALIGWDEPFGVVFAEAMSAGKPIVCANDGGINDVIIDGIHGHTVPPKNANAAAEALADLLNNSDRMKRMGKNAADLVENRLTWDANAHRMAEVFNMAATKRLV